MAKLKSKIASKYNAKPKRKLVLGGPEQELYLNNNTTYQAQDAPTMMLQNQFDTNEQEKAKRMSAISGNQLANQLSDLQDQTAASEKRKQEEQAQQNAAAEANKQAVNQQVTQTGVKVGKQIVKDAKAGLFNTVNPVASNYYSPTWAPVTPAPVAPVGPAPVMINPAMQTATSTTGDLFANAPTVGQNMATTTTTSGFGQTAAAVGKSVGGAALVAAPAIVGQVASNQLNKADDRQMKRENRSQYYDDTDYSRKEFNAQLLKSTGKGATIGGTIGSAVPVVGTGVGMAVGAVVGAIAGTGKALTERRRTKTEDERGFKIGNKKFGDKLLFGNENVYDENLDPTVIEKRNREKQLKAMTDTATAMDNARMGSMMQSDVNTGFGIKNSTFEAKYGGSIKKLKGGVAKSIGKGAIEYVGRKHEYGGIDLPGNIEVEGGETEQNDYIFSATLKLPNGATYAQAHKALIKSGATGEEIRQLALSQEAAAGRNPNQIKGMKFAKYGGRLMYETGGDKKEPDIVVGGRSKEYWENLPVDCAQNPNQEGCYKKDPNNSNRLNDIQRYYNGQLASNAINSNVSYDEFLQKYNKIYANTISGVNRGSSIQGAIKNINQNIESLNKELNNSKTSEEDKIFIKTQLKDKEQQLQNLNKGLLPIPSREEYEFYRGQRDNPDTTIPNPANGTILPNADLWSEDIFSNGKPVMGATQGEEGRQASEYGPMLRGRDMTTLPRQQAQLAQYNLPNITVNNTSTFVPDEEPVTQNTVKNELKAASPEFLKEKGFVKQDNGEYQTLDADKNLITYDPKTKEYRYITTKKVNTPDGYRMGASISFSNYDDINKIKTELDTFNKKDFNNAEKTEFTTNLEKKYLGKTSVEETNETEKPKTTTTTNVDATAYKPPITTQSPNTVTTNPPVTTNTTTTNPPAVTTNTTVTNPPVTTQTNNPPVTTTNTNIPTTNNNQPTANPTYNTYNMPYQYTATNKGALDYSDPNVAGGIWAGDKYNIEWKPLVSGTMSDAGKADKVISYLENYNGQDAADVKAKIAGKTRDEKIAIINRLATDNKVGPFHNAVLEGINTTKETPPPNKIPGDIPEIPKDEGTPPPVKKDYTIELPPAPTYTRTKSTNGLGLIQAIPAAIALTNNIKTKDITPSLATGYVQPGAVGRINLGRIQYNAERAANQQNQAAMNQALQNMSGPGAVAGMLAAKTKADQQSMQIAQAEQNTNMGRAGEEAKINTGISQFNVGQAMAAQQTNAQLGQANAARIQQANQFNRQLGYARDVENREQRLGALDRGAQAITMNALANRQLDVTENLASVQDYTNAYKRYLDTIAPTLKTTTTTTEDETKTKVKFGGVKKYVSRLGDLKNNRTFKA